MLSYRPTVIPLLARLALLLLMLSLTVLPALAQPGQVPRAIDGQSLSDQSAETQAAFTAMYGDQAPQRWVAEHNAALTAQQAPTTAGTAPQPTPTRTPAPTATGPTRQAPQRLTVDIQGFRFNPPSVSGRSISIVTWTNRDPESHTVTGPNFDSGPLRQGESISIAFSSVERISYFCRIHPNMRGEIVIQ